MNQRYAIIRDLGAKTRVIHEKHDPMLDRYRLVIQTFEDFRNGYMNELVEVGQDAKGNPKFMPLGHWWLAHPKRRTYESLVFMPGYETPEDYNMWRGFAYEAKPGDAHEPFLEHVFENICSADQAIYDYVVGWMARTVQKPHSPGETAIVMRGNQGVGKGFLAKHFGRLFGRHFVPVTNAAHLTGNFNFHLWDCVVLFADEAFYAGDKRHASVLKTLVTEDSMMIEGKGLNLQHGASCLHIMMASNEDWVIPAGERERRFCVLDVSETKIQDARYFGRIAEYMRTGGYENLLHYLQNYDINLYDVRALPKTKALRDQKMYSYSPVEDWWYNKLENGRVLPDHDSWETHVSTNQLVADYVEFTKAFNTNRRGSATRLGHFMKQICPGLKRVQGSQPVTVRVNGEDKTIHRPYLYVLKSLADMREWWDKNKGGPFDWPPIEEQQEFSEAF
jgi:hypothetical protein